MRKAERRDWIEVFIGGAFGIIAIIAAIVEYCSDGSGAFAGCIKDIAGTLVVVVILFASLEIKPRNIDKVLNNALQEWVNQHSNMVFILSSIEDRDIYMKTDINNFFIPGSSSGKGRFVKIEKTKNNCLKMIFSLNKGLFIGHDGEKLDTAALLEPYGSQFEKYIQQFNNIATSHYNKSTYNLIVEMKKTTNTKEDVADLLEIIDTMYNGFLVLASVKA